MCCNIQGSQKHYVKWKRSMVVSSTYKAGNKQDCSIKILLFTYDSKGILYECYYLREKNPFKDDQRKGLQSNPIFSFIRKNCA